MPAKRPIYRYEPNTSNPDRAVGITLPFNKAAEGRNDQQDFSSGSLSGGSVFALSYTTEEQSISNLKNLLLTIKGERIMQPDFGTNIRSTLFEPNTKLIVDNLKASLANDIKFWLPYINLKEINVVRDVNAYSISIRIRYTVNSSIAERVIVILANENELLLSDIDAPLELTQIGTF
jgi:phage baseplate assembly protein W